MIWSIVWQLVVDPGAQSVTVTKGELNEPPEAAIAEGPLSTTTVAVLATAAGGGGGGGGARAAAGRAG